MKAPMLIPLLALVTGIFCARLGLGAFAGGLAVIAGCGVYVLLRSLSRDPLSAYKFGRWQPVWIVLWFAGIGVLDYDLRRPYESDFITSEQCAGGAGRIVSIANSTGGDRCTIDVFRLYTRDGIGYDCRNLRILAYSDAVEVNVDDLVTFPARFARIDVETDISGGGYQDYLASKGILYRCDVPGMAFKKTGRARTLQGVSNSCRDVLVASIESTPLAMNARNFLIAILLGERAYLHPDLRDGFADAGISHVLALSGMHIGIIASFFLVLLFPLNFKGWYRQRMLLAGLLLSGYAFVTGFGYSTVRACIMAWCMILCLWLERKNSAWNALLLSAFIILLIDPFAVSDAGLGLSFLCVASLLFFASPLNLVDKRSHPKLYRVNGLLICTLVATFGSWALTAYVFGTFPPAFLVANIVVLPLLPLYLSISIIYICCSAVGFAPGWLTWLIDSGYSVLEKFVIFLNGETSGALHVDMPAWALSVWVTGLILLAVSINSRRKNIWAVPGAVCLLVSISAVIFSDGVAERYFMDNHGRIPTVKALIHGEIKDMRFSAGAVSGISIGNVKILSVDCSPEGFCPEIPEICDYLVLTKSFTGTLTSLEGKIKTGNIILHPTMTRKREAALKAEADSLGLPCRSLRTAPVEITR